MSKSKTIETPAGSPSELQFEPKEVFKSVGELVEGLDALVRFLNRHYKRKNPLEGNLYGFILEKMRIEFSRHIASVELQMEYAQSTIVILVPEDNSPTKVREQRRMKILTEFASILPEAQFRSTVQFWLALTPLARKNLTIKTKAGAR